MAQLQHIVGDTLEWSCARTDDNGDPLAVSTVDACFSRLGALTVTIDNASGGLFTISATAAVTADWSPGVYRGDVTFTATGTESTDTFSLLVQAGYDC